MDDRQYIKELESRCCKAVKKIEELSDEVDKYQQHEDEIIVALGSRGILSSEIVSKVEQLTAENTVLEAKRKALWYRLVGSLQNEGLSLGEAQIEADYTMDLAVKSVSGSHQHKWEMDPHKPDWKLCKCGAGLPPSIIADSRLCPDCGEPRGYSQNCINKIHSMSTLVSGNQDTDSIESLPQHESIDHMAGSMTADILRARDNSKQPIDPDVCEHGIPWNEECGWCFQAGEEIRGPVEKGHAPDG